MARARHLSTTDIGAKNKIRILVSKSCKVLKLVTKYWTHIIEAVYIYIYLASSLLTHEQLFMDRYSASISQWPPTLTAPDVDVFVSN